MFQRVRQLALGLDPARSLGRIAEYDLDRGFDDFAAACRAAGDPPLAPSNGAELQATAEMQARGVTCLDVLSADLAAELRRRVVDLPVVPPRKDEIDYSDSFELPEVLRRELVHAILNGPVADTVARHFGSHFLVYDCVVTRLRPGTAAKRSMLWHCDSGPTRHLKLLVYLEDSQASGANTTFLDRQTSDALLEAGYTFGSLRHRRGDLTGLTRRLGVRFEPHTWPVAAGQGLLFEPARVLHRGVVPDRAARHMVTLVLLPSPKPWAEVYAARGRMTVGFEGYFPKQAKDLLQQL